MNITTDWDNEDQTIIRMLFQPEWLIEDLHTAIEDADKLIASVDHQVDIIIDIQNGMRIPKDFMSVAKEILANPNPRPNEGQKVVVGANGPIKFLYNTVYKAFSNQLGERRLIFEKNLDKARTTLDNMRMQDA